jgi:hypothetical protein
MTTQLSITISHQKGDNLTRTLQSLACQVGDLSQIEIIIKTGEKLDKTLKPLLLPFSPKLNSKPSGKYLLFFNSGDTFINNDDILTIFRELKSAFDIYQTPVSYEHVIKTEVKLINIPPASDFLWGKIYSTDFLKKHKISLKNTTGAYFNTLLETYNPNTGVLPTPIYSWRTEAYDKDNTPIETLVQQSSAETISQKIQALSDGAKNSNSITKFLVDLFVAEPTQPFDCAKITFFVKSNLQNLSTDAQFLTAQIKRHAEPFRMDLTFTQWINQFLTEDAK